MLVVLTFPSGPVAITVAAGIAASEASVTTPCSDALGCPKAKDDMPITSVNNSVFIFTMMYKRLSDGWELLNRADIRVKYCKECTLKLVCKISSTARLRLFWNLQKLRRLLPHRLENIDQLMIGIENSHARVGMFLSELLG